MDPELISILLEIINCAILVVDPEGTIILSNTKAKGVFCPDATPEVTGLEGLPIEMIFMPEDRGTFLPNILKITVSRGEFEGEALLKDLSGKSFFAIIATSVCHLNDKKAIIFTIHDITSLKSIEKAFKKDKRLTYLGRMLDDISHQIRNPVVTIGGFARRMMNMEGEHKRYAGIILSECTRLELLLSKLTEFVNLPRPKPRPVSLEHLIPLVKDPAAETAQSFSGTISWQLPDPIPEKKVLVDDAVVPKVIVPIVENAFEAYEKKSRRLQVSIAINIWREGRFPCYIEITDKGIGIDPKTLQKVFDPFFTTKTGHIGMGLTFVKRIVDELYGEITVQSEYGTGTTTTIALSGDRRRIIRRRIL